VLHEDVEVLINEMPKVLKEISYQGEVLCHLEVLGLIKPCHFVWINKATSGLFQELLLEHLIEFNCLYKLHMEA
jgi:hypothetical protein